MTGSVGSASPEELFGQGVRAARQARGWSQDALAAELAKVGTVVGGQSGVARIERGERPTRLNEVVAIANFLGLDLGIELGLFRPTAQLSAGEELDMELAVAVGRLEAVEAELAQASLAAQQAQDVAETAKARTYQLNLQRQTLMHERNRLAHHLHGVADARRRLELESKFPPLARRYDRVPGQKFKATTEAPDGE